MCVSGHFNDENPCIIMKSQITGCQVLVLICWLHPKTDLDQHCFQNRIKGAHWPSG